MPQFIFTILDKDKMTRDGILQSSDRESAFKSLSETYGTVLELKEIKEKRGLFTPRVSSEDLMVMTYQIATMLRSGLTLSRTLEVVAADTEDANMQIILVDISAGISEGKSFSEMLKQFPHIFSTIYVSMTEAGEQSGKLPEILTKLAQYIENSEELKRKVKAALYYPVTVILLAASIATFIFIFGVKQFEEIYSGLGAELPPLTKLFINLGNFFYANWVFISIGLFALLYFIRKYFNTEKGIQFRDKLLLSLPVISPIIRRVAIARFARTLGALYEGGVSILTSLQLVSGSMGNRVLEKVVLDALQQVREGESITYPLRKSKAFTKMAVGMIATGEESGTLPVMLYELAKFYEIQVDVMLRAMAGMIEPFVIVMVGIFVAILIVVMGMPMFNLVQILA